MTLLNIFWIRKSVEIGNGLPRLGQIFSYLNILSCGLAPILCDINLKRRLILISFSLLNLYYHLSISYLLFHSTIFFIANFNLNFKLKTLKSYESLFLIFLCFQMVSWLLIESFEYTGEFNIEKVKSNLAQINYPVSKILSKLNAFSLKFAHLY